MYKKILFGSIALLFAAASAFNIGLLQTQDAGDISLDAIAIMAQAQGNELPEVTVYGCSKWLEIPIDGSMQKGCFYYTSDTPCSREC